MPKLWNNGKKADEKMNLNFSKEILNKITKSYLKYQCIFRNLINMKTNIKADTISGEHITNQECFMF